MGNHLSSKIIAYYFLGLLFLLIPKIYAQDKLLVQIKGEIYSIGYTGENKTQITFTNGSVLAFTQFYEGGGFYYGAKNGNNLDIYSQKLSKNSNAVYLTTLNDPGSQLSITMFNEKCGATVAKMFLSQDKKLCITCGCNMWSYTWIYKINLADNSSQLVGITDETPEVERTSIAKNIQDKLFTQEGNLYIRTEAYSTKRISFLEKIPFQGLPIPGQKLSLGKYEVSPKGRAVLFDVQFPSMGDRQLGKTYYFDFNKGIQAEVFNDLTFYLVKSWDINNEILFNIQAGTEQTQYKNILCKFSVSTGINEQVQNVIDVLGVEVINSQERTEIAEPKLDTKNESKELGNFVFVEGGSFTMGSNNGFDYEKPVHTVIVNDFYLGKNEVTVSEYRNYCKATGKKMPQEPESGWQDNEPIVNVNWFEANDYCYWAGGRLPTEAEWEFAAMGGKNSKGYNFSGSNLLSEVSWYKENSQNRPQEVGKKKSNELGFYDMTGNVWEWCNDWYSEKYYNISSPQNPIGPESGTLRALRGGSYGSVQNYARVTNRYGKSPETRFNAFGFRVAKSK